MLYIFNKLAWFINFKQIKLENIVIIKNFTIFILSYKKVNINV
jgi:hypothetical protein